MVNTCMYVCVCVCGIGVKVVECQNAHWATKLRKTTWWKPSRLLVAARHLAVVFCALVVTHDGALRVQPAAVVCHRLLFRFLFVYPLCLRK